MFCSNCGKELKEDDKFCSGCGKRVVIEETKSFEEVVFNPAFRKEENLSVHLSEYESKTDVKERKEPKKKIDTIDFSWNLDGFPTDKKKSTEEVDFDWSTPLEQRREKAEEVKIKEALEKVETTPVEASEPRREENHTAMEDREPNSFEPKPLGKRKDPFESEMPKGNGISAEDFLKELKDHAERKEREAEKRPIAEEEEGEKRGFLSKLKGAFVEKVDEDEGDTFLDDLERTFSGHTTFGKTDDLTIEEDDSQAAQGPKTSEEQIEEEAVQTEEEPQAETPEQIEEEPQVEIPEQIEVEPKEDPFEEVIIEQKEEDQAKVEEIPKYRQQDEFAGFPGEAKQGTANGDDLDVTRRIDKFYTFNQKNESFQQLLDQEYERIKGERPVEEVKEEVKHSNQEASRLAAEMVELKESAEAKSQEGEKPTQKPTWNEIFGDDDEEDEGEKSRGGIKALIIILVIIALILGAALGVKTFAPDSGAAALVNKCVLEVTNLINGVKGDNDTPKSTEITSWILSQSDKNKNIGTVEEDTSLLYDPEVKYGVTALESSYAFIDSTYNKSKDGNTTTYGEEIVGTVVGYYSQWVDFINGNDNKLQSYVEADSDLFTALSQTGTADVKTGINRLAIGDIRTSDEGFFVILSTEIAKAGSDKIITDNYVVYLTTGENRMYVSNITKF